nr:hypothetical protein [Liquorilactobacillus uvarum]
MKNKRNKHLTPFERGQIDYLWNIEKSITKLRLHAAYIVLL